ncbi:hypothetical protein [Helicobacter marmotae]|uniref:hypothetical protein n=1 Tax=Helicobacter marmotae TaxID=152490 RepID=UPI001315439E|nr:hypothetical protein [Helicobacter marmotae]
MCVSKIMCILTLVVLLTGCGGALFDKYSFGLEQDYQPCLNPLETCNTQRLNFNAPNIP